MVDKLEAAEAGRRNAMRDHEQMLDAEGLCVPCKLCGGAAKISDAGTGAGYYIKCGNSTNWRDSTGCLINERRLGGWAYNVMDWWNRLHAATPANGEQVEPGKLKTAYLALLTISQEDDGSIGRYAAKIARAVEPDATPTEDARSRVKVLEEALREVIDFAEVPNMSLSSDYYRGARMAWDVTAEIARTALGNKETDRHG